MSRSVQGSPTEKKKREGCDKFDTVATNSQTYVKSFHVPLVVRRTTSTWQGAGGLCRRRALGLRRCAVAAGDEMKEHWVFIMVLELYVWW